MTVEVYGDEIVSRKLIRFSDRANNMSPVWDEVTEQLKADFERNFAQEGPGWSPLKPSTVRSRIAQGYPPGPILTRSGKYRTAMTVELETHKSPNELVVMAPEVPGRFHQWGTRKMVSRPMRLKEQEKRDIVKTLQRGLIEGYA